MLATTFRICEKCHKTFEVLTNYEGDNICLSCQGYFDNPKDKPMEIVIKNQDINIKNNTINQRTLPKPSNLNEFIGQHENKESIKTSLKVIQKIKPINFFLFGYPGCGKSTLAEIISNELSAHYIYTIPEQLKNFDIIEKILNEIQERQQLTVWMIDEIHNIDKKLINILLPILQDNKLGDTKIREFVMIGATTDSYKLYKKSEALVSRFQTKIYLEKYTINDIIHILKQYKSKLNINVNIPDNDYLLLAQNSKGIPREAINLLLKRLVINNIPQILKENKIIKNGFNTTDLKILNCLNEINKPIGSNFLSQKANLLEQDYLYIYEPYLVESGFIERTRKGRMITIQGQKFLEEIKKKGN